MPKPFNVEAERNHFALPLLTRQQIKALIFDLDMDAREVVIRSIHLRAEHRRNVAGPPATNDAAAFHRETVRYTQEHSAQAIAP
jgi:hypothetical protein